MTQHSRSFIINVLGLLGLVSLVSFNWLDLGPEEFKPYSNYLFGLFSIAAILLSFFGPRRPSPYDLRILSISLLILCIGLGLAYTLAIAPVYLIMAGFLGFLAALVVAFEAQLRKNIR